jgi:hypothetical protein
MEAIHRSLKPVSYYWEFLKRFGEECYRSWRQEVFGACLTTLIIFSITRHQDKNAWEVARVTLEANLIFFTGFVLFHLIRTPYLLHRERLRPDQGRERVVGGLFGFIGAALLLVIVGAGAY